MGRFDGFLLLWDKLLVSLGIPPQPWMLPACVLLLGALSWPLIRRTQRISSARKLVAEAQRASGPERLALQDQVMAQVGRHPMGLVGVVEESLRRQQTDLARRALDTLHKTGKERIHAKRLQASVHGPPPTSVDAELAVIERLVEAEMFGQATERLDRALGRWPDDERLAAVHIPPT